MGFGWEKRAYTKVTLEVSGELSPAAKGSGTAARVVYGSSSPVLHLCPSCRVSRIQTHSLLSACEPPGKTSGGLVRVIRVLTSTSTRRGGGAAGPGRPGG